MKVARHLSRLLLIASLGAWAASAGAGAYPDREIKLIVPFAPGGAVDFTARLIAEVGESHFDGRKFVINNIPAGGAVVGQSTAAKSRPDGYTLLATTSSIINNTLTKKVAYALDSFEYLALYNLDPEVLVVPADSPFKDTRAMLAAARAAPMTVATSGHSTSHHIAGLVLERKTGARFNYLHNQSAAMQMQQVMGGHVQAAFMSLGEASGPMRDGKLRIVALFDDKRSDLAPDVPTFNETEEGSMVWGTFRGLSTPAGLAPEIKADLAGRLQAVINDKTFVERMNKAGYTVVYRDPAAFDAYLKEVAERMKEVLPPTDEGR